MSQKAPQSAPPEPNEQDAARETARDEVIKEMKKMLHSYDHMNSKSMSETDDAVIALQSSCRVLGFGPIRAHSLLDICHKISENSQSALEFYRRVTGDTTAQRITRDTFFTKFRELLKQMPDDAAFLAVLDRLSAPAQPANSGGASNANTASNTNTNQTSQVPRKYELPKMTGIGAKEKPVDKDLAKARLQTFFRIHGTSGLMGHMMRHVLGGDAAIEKLTGKKVDAKKVDAEHGTAEPAKKDEHAKDDKKDDKKEKDKNPEKKGDDKKADEKGHGAHAPAKAAH